MARRAVAAKRPSSLEGRVLEWLFQAVSLASLSPLLTAVISPFGRLIALNVWTLRKWSQFLSWIKECILKAVAYVFAPVFDRDLSRWAYKYGFGGVRRVHVAFGECSVVRRGCQGPCRPGAP